MLHELGFTLTLSACQHVLPCFLDLVFIGFVDAVARYGRHYKEPVFGDAILIVYRQQCSWSTIRYGMQAFTVLYSTSTIQTDIVARSLQITIRVRVHFTAESVI